MAARQTMVADGFADADDLVRWEAALTQLDRAAARPTSVLATFSAIGRRPG